MIPVCSAFHPMMRWLMLVLVLVVATPAHAGVLDEPIGPLRRGMTDMRVKRAAGPPRAASEPQRGEATGMWEKSWDYPGVRLWFEAKRARGTPWVLRAIDVRAGSDWKTRRGISIGSTRAQVARAYRRDTNKAESTADQIVAGSSHGGVTFTMVDDRVTEIFVGAAF
jgi:hypothetical protein